MQLVPGRENGKITELRPITSTPEHEELPCRQSTEKISIIYYDILQFKKTNIFYKDLMKLLNTKLRKKLIYVENSIAESRPAWIEQIYLQVDGYF